MTVQETGAVEGSPFGQSEGRENIKSILLIYGWMKTVWVTLEVGTFEIQWTALEIFAY